jgi:hypothetical protein
MSFENEMPKTVTKANNINPKIKPATTPLNIGCEIYLSSNFDS